MLNCLLLVLYMSFIGKTAFILVLYMSYLFLKILYKPLNYISFLNLTSIFYSPLRGRRLGGSAFSNALALRKGGNSIEWMAFIKWSSV